VYGVKFGIIGHCRTILVEGEYNFQRELFQFKVAVNHGSKLTRAHTVLEKKYMKVSIK